MSAAMNEIRSNRWLLLAVCMSGLLLGAAASADDRDGRRHDDSHWNRDRHDERRGDWDRDDHRHHRNSYRNDHHDRRDWSYYNGRYWAPPRYRGRECTDHRHYRGRHYHVSASDYYDYYYPRYRYYGPRPHSVNASVIITVPLF
jgi:hypothetical protein